MKAILVYTILKKTIDINLHDKNLTIYGRHFDLQKKNAAIKIEFCSCLQSNRPITFWQNVTSISIFVEIIIKFLVQAGTSFSFHNF